MIDLLFMMTIYSLTMLFDAMIGHATKIAKDRPSCIVKCNRL